MQTATNTQSRGRYKYVTDLKADGATYTPSKLAHFVAAQIVEAAKLPDKEIHILDPAIGDGELIISLLEKIATTANTSVVVHGFDINPAAVELTRLRISASFPHVELRLDIKDFLAYAAEENSPNTSLFSPQSEPRLFDLIIANQCCGFAEVDRGK